MNSEFAIAVHALVFLNHKREILPSDSLAKNVCTNPARIRKVMGKLKKAGLICTKEGSEGGYYLCLDAACVTLRQVYEALGVSIVSSGWQSGDVSMPCMIASGMGQIMEDIYCDAEEGCKSRLQQITIKDIDRKIFKQNEQQQFQP